MTTATGCALIGSLFVAFGLSGVLWRYFRIRSRGAGGASRVLQPPALFASWTLVVLGLILIVSGFLFAESPEDPPPFAVFVATLAAGLCLMVPGVMIFARSLPSVKRWSETHPSVNPPWMAQLGVAMMAFGLVAGGVVAPIMIVTLRQ